MKSTLDVLQRKTAGGGTFMESDYSPEGIAKGSRRRNVFGILTVVLIIFSHGIWVNLIEELRIVLKEILIKE